MTCFKHLAIFFALLLVGPLHDVHAQSDVSQTVIVTYSDYRPHYDDSSGRIEGDYADKVRAIFKKAGLTIRWQKGNLGIGARLHGTNARKYCSGGRMYTPERAKSWPYVPYIFAEIPVEQIVTRADHFEIVQRHETVMSLIQDTSLTGTFIEGSHYNDEVSAYLETKPSHLNIIRASDFESFKMVVKGHTHYTIGAPDLLAHAIATEIDHNVLKSIPYPELGDEPSPIYLVCSSALDKNIHTRIANAMRDLGYPKAHYLN